MPLLPWLALGLGMGLFTAWVERNYLGAEGATFNLNFLERCLLAGRVICFYLGKVFWPRNLVFIYPHWRVSGDLGWQYLFPLGVVAGLAVLWGLRRRRSGGFGGISFLYWNSLSRPGLFQCLPLHFFLCGRSLSISRLPGDGGGGLGRLGRPADGTAQRRPEPAVDRPATDGLGPRRRDPFE